MFAAAMLSEGMAQSSYAPPTHTVMVPHGLSGEKSFAVWHTFVRLYLLHTIDDWSNFLHINERKSYILLLHLSCCSLALTTKEQTLYRLHLLTL